MKGRYVALRKITFRFDSSASQDCAWLGAVGYVGYNVNDFGLAPVAFARALVGLPSEHSVGGTPPTEAAKARRFFRFRQILCELLLHLQQARFSLSRGVRVF